MRVEVLLRAAVFLLAMGGGIPAESAGPTSQPVCDRDDGYHGFWHAWQPVYGEFKYRRSGGIATGCENNIPIACYVQAVDKTFFVYGGSIPGQDPHDPGRSVRILVSFFDHKTGQVPKPRIVTEKRAGYLYDGASLTLDEKGYLWVFVGQIGSDASSGIFRSRQPYAIDAFEHVEQMPLACPQAWWIKNHGLVLLYSQLGRGTQQLSVRTRPEDGAWSEPVVLADFGVGHDHVSWRFQNKIMVAFNYRPGGARLDAGTNVYYLESKDFGKTWRNIQGQSVDLPLRAVENNAMAADFQKRKRWVYFKDLTSDSRGNPIILYLASVSGHPGPLRIRRSWMTSRWTHREWEHTGVPNSDNNYDTGCLFIDKIDYWRLIAPIASGPQPFNPGGEVCVLVTEDLGRSWRKTALTSGSAFNHNYVRRPVDAREDFCALWCDGNAREPSESRIYFADKDGDVYVLPALMKNDFEKPQRVVQAAAQVATRPTTQSAPSPSR